MTAGTRRGSWWWTTTKTSAATCATSSPIWAIRWTRAWTASRRWSWCDSGPTMSPCWT